MSHGTAPVEKNHAPTSADIRLALRSYFPSPGWALANEVASGSVYEATAPRRVDCIAVGIWKSTGYEIVGIEIKTSRGDLRRELADPKKTEDLIRFCHRFYLACPAGVARADDVPTNWGVLTLLPGGTLRKLKVAPLLEPQPLTPAFVAALFRRAGEADSAVLEAAVAKARRDALAEAEARFQSRVDDKVKATYRRNMEAAETLAKIRAAAGIPDERWIDGEALGKAIGFVYRNGLFGTYSTLTSLLRDTEAFAAGLRHGMKEAGLDLPNSKQERLL